MIYEHRSGDLAEICTSYFDAREKLLKFGRFEVLVIERQDMQSCKPGEQKDDRHVVVPGFVRKYRQKTDDLDLAISEVDPVPESDYAEIEKLIREISPCPFSGPVEFFKAE